MLFPPSREYGYEGARIKEIEDGRKRRKQRRMENVKWRM
jgi:hypothetical protein